MKYEKFEEWMIGKKIGVDGYEGVVLGRYFPSIVPSEVVCIQYKIGNNPTDWRWVELADVTFLEEVAHEEEHSPIPWEVGVRENSQIDWQVGQVVWDVRNGRGVVKEVNNGENYPIYVEFDMTDHFGNTNSDTYTLDGRHVETQKVRSLFFSEPVITAELYPPKKPFTPTLKKGDTVVAKRKDGRNTVVFYVVTESEDIISSSGATYKKSEWVFYKLGEEVKFQ